MIKLVRVLAACIFFTFAAIKVSICRINFSIWSQLRRTVNHVYIVDALRGSVAEGGRVRKGIFCLHLSPTSVHNLRNFLRRSSELYFSFDSILFVQISWVVVIDFTIITCEIIAKHLKSRPCSVLRALLLFSSKFWFWFQINDSCVFKIYKKVTF